MIKFHCENCGQKFKVPETQAGKKGKCPKCKDTIVVPKIQPQSHLTKQTDSEIPKVSSKSSPYDSALFAVQQKDKAQEPPPDDPE